MDVRAGDGLKSPAHLLKEMNKRQKKKRLKKSGWWPSLMPFAIDLSKTPKILSIYYLQQLHEKCADYPGVRSFKLENLT